MNAPAFSKALGRLAGSIGLSALVFLATTRLVPNLALWIWLFPGKLVAPWAASVLPRAWVHGEPGSDHDWAQVQLAGFAIGCGVLFWAIVIFAFWQWRAARGREPVAHCARPF